jgi:LmbE family N-acetylglucosaminyl deacetylase
MSRGAEPFTLRGPGAAVFVPDGASVENALRRTRRLGVAAHQDDLEIFAIDGILECFGGAHPGFTGVVTTDGAGSPRAGAFASYDDAAMRAVRRDEQRRAALIGRYSAVVELCYPSARVKAGDEDVVSDLERVLTATRPEIVYTHDLADRHDTHVAVTLRLLEAARRLPREARPARLIGCEVWRDLDWLPSQRRVVMPLAGDERLQLELLAVFDSQIAGGKRYDLATLGRRRAHATFAEHRDVDSTCAVVLGMDLTPLLDGGDPTEYVLDCVRELAEDVRGRLAALAQRT